MSDKLKELPACPVETTLSLIGDKWKVLILRDLITGTKRFGELKNPSELFHRRFSPRSSVTWREMDSFTERCMRRFRPEWNTR